MNLVNRFRAFASEDFGLSRAQVETAMQQVYRRGDRLMGTFVLCHVVVALLQATVYDTWWITIPVTLAATAMFFASAALLPGSQATRYTAGVVLQVFVALHIYQLHGLPEMHFFFFTAQTMMIVYEDYKATWPGTFLIIAQHIAFSVLQNTGMPVLFFPESYVSVQKLAFHFGIGLVQVVLCSYWAILQRRHRLHALRQSLDLEASRRRSEESAAAKTRFLANMSHEIRTPLNGVLGLADVLLRTDLSADQREYCEIIQSSGRGLLNILDDVLDMSKIEAGGMTLAPDACHLRQLLEDVAAMLMPRAATSHTELVVRIDPAAPPAIVCDSTRLRQILLNLGGNAVKFTPAGHVLLDVTFVEKNDSGCRLRFTVEDTGMGIPEEAQASIFEPFVQAHTSDTQRFRGTGLGLAISQKLVELMGGRISVTSKVGAGSRFEFTLQAPVPPVEAAPATFAVDGLRLLLLEPHGLRRRVLNELLRSRGVTVIEVQSLAQARMRRADADILLASADAIDGAAPPMPLVILHRLDQPKPPDGGAFPVEPHWILAPPRADKLLELLSRLRAPGSAIEARPDVASVQVSGTRVLLAEDNHVNQIVATAMLRRLGCSVDIAANGAQAVEMVRRGAYDIVFMDCQMPVLDGLEATAQIRRLEAGGSRIPVVALTANAMDGERDRCYRAGMDAYLTKPVSLERLQEALAKFAAKNTPALCE